MVGGRGWGEEDALGADGSGTRCVQRWRLPPGNRQVPTSTPKGRGRIQPVLPAATHASNSGERPGGSHPSLRVERRGDGHLLGTTPVAGDKVQGVTDNATRNPLCWWLRARL